MTCRPQGAVWAFFLCRWEGELDPQRPNKNAPTQPPPTKKTTKKTGITENATRHIRGSHRHGDRQFHNSHLEHFVWVKASKALAALTARFLATTCSRLAPRSSLHAFHFFTPMWDFGAVIGCFSLLDWDAQTHTQTHTDPQKKNSGGKKGEIMNSLSDRSFGEPLTERQATRPEPQPPLPDKTQGFSNGYGPFYVRLIR